MSGTSVDVCGKRFLVLTTLVGVSLLVAGSWQAWNWLGYNRRVPQTEESETDQSPTDIDVTDENDTSEHLESRTATRKRHDTTRDEHRKHHHHHEHHHRHHRHAKTLSSKSQGSQSKHSSGAHRETEQLVHPRSQTEPNYSATPHPTYERPEAAKRSSQILSFHNTHDEPASMSHPDEHPEELGRKRGVSSLSRGGDDKRPYPFNGTSTASHSNEDGHGGHVSVDDLRSVLEKSRESTLGTLRVEHPEDFSDYITVHDVPRASFAPGIDVPGRRYRSLALEEGKLRKEAYESSKRAYKSGRKVEAKKLSEEGKLHDENMKRYNALAAAEIFAANNPRYSTGRQLTRCDLHGLHVDEAMEYSKNHLVNCRTTGTEKTMLIVGKGSHSQQGGARIKPAIMAMLEGVGGIVASLHEKNEGCIVVEFIAM